MIFDVDGIFSGKDFYVGYKNALPHDEVVALVTSQYGRVLPSSFHLAFLRSSSSPFISIQFLSSPLLRSHQHSSSLHLHSSSFTLPSTPSLSSHFHSASISPPFTISAFFPFASFPSVPLLFPLSPFHLHLHFSFPSCLIFISIFLLGGGVGAVRYDRASGN